ncbi:MAG: TatD family hydrolase [Chloroflexi bacterium]|nr:TatD family hydrolase [Chloroflexota bacterium]
MYIDTHCHLDFERFEPDRDEVVVRALAAGIRRMIVPAIDLQNGAAVLQLTEQYENVYAAVGVHPNSTAGWQDSWLDDVRSWAQHPKVVAIGEIGLDYYWDRAPKEMQQRALCLQLELAAELNLPVIIHNREASADVIRMLAESPLAGRPNPGVLHSFAADWETAQAALEMGYYLGFTGPVTYKKAADLREIVARVPLDRILVETDAPFLSPQIGKKRPSRNEPAFVTFVAERIAVVRRVETAVIAKHTTQNAHRLFPRMKLHE